MFLQQYVVCFVPGGSPYPDLPMTQEFYSALKRGYRMTRPDHAPHSMYDTQHTHVHWCQTDLKSWLTLDMRTFSRVFYGLGQWLPT